MCTVATKERVQRVAVHGSKEALVVAVEWVAIVAGGSGSCPCVGGDVEREDGLRKSAGVGGSEAGDTPVGSGIAADDSGSSGVVVAGDGNGGFRSGSEGGDSGSGDIYQGGEYRRADAIPA